MLSKYLFSKKFLDVARLDPKHFTRQRTLTLPTVVSFLLSGVRAAVQSELDQFFANLRAYFAERDRSFRLIVTGGEMLHG